MFAPSECGEGQPNDDQITRDRVCSNVASTARSSKCDHSANRNSRATRIQKWCVIEPIVISLRTEPHAQPLLTVGDHKGSGTITQSSSGVEGVAYPIRKACDFTKISCRKDPEQVFP